MGKNTFSRITWTKKITVYSILLNNLANEVLITTMEDDRGKDEMIITV